MKNYSGVFIVILVIVVILVLFNANSSPGYDFSDTAISLPNPTPDNDSSANSSTGSDIDSDGSLNEGNLIPDNGEYYNQLSDFQKRIYMTLLPAIRNAESEITVKNVNTTEFRDNCLRVTKAIQYDHPELFWYTGGYRLSMYNSIYSDNGRVVFKPRYYNYASSAFNYISKSAELEAAVKRLAALAKASSEDDYDRMIFVHDYLVENAYYDHDSLEEYYKTDHAPACEYIFSAYGCLVNGTSVCSGYAKAFQLVMQELGYECYYITGTAGEAHGWNYVYIDGEGYYVDVTWDDYDMDKENPVYNYAFITGDALARTHTVNTEYNVPDCNGTEYNYYRYYGYYDAEYDFETAKRILSSQKNNSAQHIQFGSLEELDKAYEELLKNAKIYDILGKKSGIRLRRNKTHYTMMWYIEENG